jgi:dephospho-CoA kinase
MRVVGLTGSIGMGKSTTAALFKAGGVAVHDADAAVHRLYAGKAVAPVEALFHGVSVDGVIDRRRLSERILSDPGALARLEAVVHPLVRDSEAEFLAKCRAEGRAFAVLEVPLLFETGRFKDVDAVVVVTAAAEIQRARVTTRPGMTEEKLEALLARQVPDVEKRRRAHFLVDSSGSVAAAGRQVDGILRALAFTA